MTIFDKEENAIKYVSAKIRAMFCYYRSVRMYFKCLFYKLDIGGIYHETYWSVSSRHGKWIVIGFNYAYYPQIGIELRNYQDPTYTDACSLKRFKRDYKKIEKHENN